MIIILTDQYRITSDAHNIILQVKKTGKNGKGAGVERWIDKNFYPTIECAVSSMVNKRLLTSELEGVQSIVNEIKTSTANICERIKVSQKL